MIRALLTVLVFSFVAGCASTEAPVYLEPERRGEPVKKKRAELAPVMRQSVASRAARVAEQQLGRPYRYGAKGPSAFDCSGLVHYSYGQTGYVTPRTTAALWSGTVPVARQALREGDILFFRIEGKMSHVGIYLGNGKFVHAPSSGRHVSVQTLASDFYDRAFIRGGRLPGSS